MKYRSTRGAKDNALTSPAAIIQGLEIGRAHV